MSTAFTPLASGAAVARVAIARVALPVLLVVGVQGGGTFKPLRGVSTPGGVAGARPADVSAMKATVARIDELFRRDPVLAPPPSDVLIQPFGTVSATPASMQAQPTLMAGYSIFLLHPKERCGSSGCRSDPGEGPELRVRINNPLAIIGLGGGYRPADWTRRESGDDVPGQAPDRRDLRLSAV